MATLNQLNQFKSYTYHFALFVNRSGEAIEAINSFPEVATSRTSGTQVGTSTLIVNSVKDPFHIIDDVNFTYINSFVNTGQPLVAGGELSLRVIESGNCMFMHKLKSAMSIHGADLPSFVVFGLLIEFVGIDENNVVSKIQVPIIPMILADMRSSFDHRGSEYNMKFVMTAFAASTSNPTHTHSLQFGTIPQTITVKANMLADALNLFSGQLNNNYQQTLQKETNAEGLRKITYKINVPPELAGCTIRSTSNQDSSPGSLYHFSIPAGMQIPDAIRKIIEASPEACALVSDAKAFKRELHPGSKMWVIMPKAKYLESSVELEYDIKMYSGDNNERYEYDFYFTENPNVDVIGYEVTFAQTTMIYLSTAYDSSLDANFRMSNSTESKSVAWQNSIAENKKVERQLLNSVVEPVTGSSACIAMPQAAPNIVIKGMTSTRVVDVPSKKEALNAMSAAMSADFAQKTLKIRGNPELLKRCVAHTGGMTSFGIEGGIWVKVNIFAQDDETGARIPYYYQGWYHLISVQSSFHDGKFEQDLTLVMMFSDSAPGEG